MSSMGTGRGAAQYSTSSSSSSSSSSSPSHIDLFGASVPCRVPYYLSDKGQAVPNAIRHVILSAGGHGCVLMTESVPFSSGIDIPSEGEWETMMASRDDHKLVSMANFTDKNAVCQGYMAVDITCEREVWTEGTAETKWQSVKKTETRTMRFVTTAHNILATKSNGYVLHTVKGKDTGSQIHVEQICMFRLAGLLEALKDAGCNVTDYRGDIRFKGGMPTVCAGCKGTATALGMTEKLSFMKS